MATFGSGDIAIIRYGSQRTGAEAHRPSVVTAGEPACDRRCCLRLGGGPEVLRRRRHRVGEASLLLQAQPQRVERNGMVRRRPERNLGLPDRIVPAALEQPVHAIERPEQRVERVLGDGPIRRRQLFPVELALQTS